MQVVSCYNCGSNKSGFYASENGFTLVKCDKCGLLYVSPRPNDKEIEQAHKVGIHRGAEAIDVTGVFDQSQVTAYLMILEDFFYNELTDGHKTWLDIGCGHGEFLLALQQFSKGKIFTKGLDPNINKQKSAQQRGLDVTYFDLDRHTDQYDVVSFLNVYSHLPDPPATIAAWKHLLKPRGELFLETGDTANLASKDHYRPFYLPDHLSFASEDIIIGILERTGFEIIEIKKYPYIRFSFFSCVKEIAKIFWPNKESRLKYMKKMYESTDMYIRARLKS